MKSHARFLTVLFICLLPVALWAAEPYKVGDTFAGFTTKDQHDQTFTFTPGPRLVVVAFAMGEGKAANSFFEQQPKDFLEKHQALFVSNIYGMPGIGRAFALPKMRKYPHRILLADAEDFLARYPAQKDKVTVFELDGSGVIKGIRFVDPRKELPAIFTAAKP